MRADTKWHLILACKAGCCLCVASPPGPFPVPIHPLLVSVTGLGRYCPALAGSQNAAWQSNLQVEQQQLSQAAHHPTMSLAGSRTAHERHATTSNTSGSKGQALTGAGPATRLEQLLGALCKALMLLMGCQVDQHTLGARVGNVDWSDAREQAPEQRPTSIDNE